MFFAHAIEVDLEPGSLSSETVSSLQVCLFGFRQHIADPGREASSHFSAAVSGLRPITFQDQADAGVVASRTAREFVAAGANYPN